MPMVDWIFLGILLTSLLLGVWRGLMFEVLSVVSWLAAFILAQWLAPAVSLQLPMAGSAQSIRYAAAFVLVFVLTVFAGGLLAALIKKVFSAFGLAPADRALGALFGLVRGLVLILAATVVIGMTSLKSSGWWQESMGAGLSVAALKGLKPALPDEFGKYLPL